MNFVFTQPGGCDATGGTRRPVTPLLLHAAAATVGGAVTGGGLGLAGAAIKDALPAGGWLLAVVAVGAVSVFAIALQLRGRVAPLPQRHAQVPRRWTLWRPHRVAVAFGAMLGAGVFTYLHQATMYVLGGVVVLFASPAVGALLGGTYGLTRGLMPLQAWLRPWVQPEDDPQRRLWALAARALPPAATVALGTASTAVLVSTFG